MKKRVLSLFMVLVLCLTLLPTAAFAEGEDVSISGGVIGGGETGGEGGGIYVAPGSPTEGGGGTYIPGEDTRTEIWCVSKPDSIGRGYDGTTDGDTIPIDLTFTDGTNLQRCRQLHDFFHRRQGRLYGDEHPQNADRHQAESQQCRDHIPLWQ